MAYVSSHMGTEHDTYTTKSDFINLFYPIGSIYISVNSVSPAILFGGTWVQIENTFLLASSNNYIAGTTGGSATNSHTHTQVAVRTVGPSTTETGSTVLTAAQIPSHRHYGIYINDSNNFWYSNALFGVYLYNTNPNSGNLKPTTTSWSATDSNMQFTQNTMTGPQGSGQGHTHPLSHTHDIGTTTTGEASNVNNMPPYLVVYMWKRTA